MLHQEIKNKITESMKVKNQVALDTYRGILSALTNDLVAHGKKPNEALNDEEVLAVITKLAKQRKDSIEQFKKGNRDDLVQEEEAQLAILELYLPKMMDRNEVEKILKAKKEELNISEISQKGMLMSVVMKELKGKADGSMVKEIVDSLF
jgi:uncharacterized protein YqeY